MGADQKRLANKVLVVGWDAADWKVINPLLDKGELPALESLINQGVCGNISSLDPMLSPMLWTSIATGKRPQKHGILGFLEPDDSGQRLQRVQSTSRRCKAIWNILQQNGLKSHVVGWWPSHPAEPGNGVMVSNFFPQAGGKSTPRKWPIVKGAIHPEKLMDALAEMRVHPAELTEAHILPFIPGAATIDQKKDRSLQLLSKNIAEASSIHCAATWIMENQPDWDFMGVYYEAIYLLCHGFMKFHPPRMAHIPEDLFELYRDVITGIYKYHDMMLERLLQLAGEDTTVILLSDHGFFSDHNRPVALPQEPAAIAYEHRPLGIFVAKGPHIKKDDRIYGASILDITPTVLTLFGLPVGQDMDGKPLLNLFEDSIIPQAIPSWEAIEGDTGQYPPNYKSIFYESDEKEAIQELAALGYVEHSEEGEENKNLVNTINESKFYLARAHLDAQEIQQGIDILESLIAQSPGTHRYCRYLLDALLMVNNTARAREVLEMLKGEGKKKDYEYYISEGKIHVLNNARKEAISAFSKAEHLNPKGLSALHQLAVTYLSAGNYDRSISYFRKCLEINGEQPNFLSGLGFAYLMNQQFDEAIDTLLDSLSLVYFNSTAHYWLAEALFAKAMYEDAARAYEVTLRLAPRMLKAKTRLKEIYHDILKTPEKFDALFEGDRPDLPLIYIVSGMPRSGTSMMMQMLDAGGMEIFSDNVRQPDTNNPKGYYEHEAVKILHRDNRWLSQAKGKVVKVVAELLKYLPGYFRYKIIFMERDPNELLVSQSRMLEQLGKAPKGTVSYTDATKRKEQVEKIKDWMAGMENMEVLYISHKDTLTNPLATISALETFLDVSFNDPQAIVNVVDPSLYRAIIK